MKRVVARVALAAGLGLGLLTGCGGDNSDVNCNLNSCTVTLNQGVDASASVLGIDVKLVGAGNGQVQLEVAGNQVSVPVGDADPYDLFGATFVDYFDENVTELVSQDLGTGFDVHVAVNRGSLELWVTIAVAGGTAYKFYKAIGEYPQFREGLIRLISDVERFVRALMRERFSPGEQVTTVGFQLGPSLAAAETYATVAPVAWQFRNFLIYISIITTALLVCGVILLLTLLI